MNRRRFLAAAGSAALIPAYAAQPPQGGARLPHVGIYSTSPGVGDLKKYYVDPFLEGMRRLGWTEGANVVYDRVYNERGVALPQYLALMRDYARDLVARKPDVIWVDSSISALAVLDHTSSIPVVGSAVSTAIAREWARSLARPGKNFTGVSNAPPWRLGAKRLEFLLEMMPRLRRAGFLTYPDTAPGAPPEKKPSWVQEENEIRALAERRGATLISAVMGQEEQAQAAFARFAKEQVEAVLIAHHPLFQNHRKRLIELASALRIPAVGHRTYFVEDGALLSYATRLDEQMRRSARYVHRILSGSSPADLPIEEFDEVELAINRSVAKAFGLPVPASLLAREKNTKIL